MYIGGISNEINSNNRMKLSFRSIFWGYMTRTTWHMWLEQRWKQEDERQPYLASLSLIQTRSRSFTRSCGERVVERCSRWWTIMTTKHNITIVTSVQLRRRIVQAISIIFNPKRNANENKLYPNCLVLHCVTLCRQPPACVAMRNFAMTWHTISSSDF